MRLLPGGLAFGLAVLLLTPAPCAGKPPPEKTPEDEGFSRGFGYLAAFFVTSLDLKLEVYSGDFPLAARVDTNADLGLAGSFTIPRFEMGYRFGKRHVLMGSYYDLSRSGTERLDHTISIGGVEFPVNAVVNTKITTKIYRMSYTYLFHTDPKVNLGINVGLFTSVLGADMSGQIDSVVLSDSRDFDKSVTAPLPVLGFGIDYRITRKLTVTGTADWFFLRYSSYAGLLTDVQLYIAHQTFRHVGLVAGLNLQRLAGEYDDQDSLNWELDSGLIGFNLGLAFYF